MGRVFNHRLSTEREKSVLAEVWYLSDPGREFNELKRGYLKLKQVKTWGYAVHQYRNGEITGSRFSRGLYSKPVSVRSGFLVTETLTSSAKTKIRRAIQNAECDFKLFLTVTFSPSHSELNPDGTINQKWGKEKFKRFINTIKKKYDRKSEVSGNDQDRINYVWVAELQENGNLHFHGLFNKRIPIEWLRKVWGQASNSIEVTAVSNANHACCYLRKYITKGEKQLIEGNRYAISQNLRATMKPERIEFSGSDSAKECEEIIESFKEIIEENGGKVLDFGFYVPPPRKKEAYREKKTKKIKYTKATSRHLAGTIIEEMYSNSPF